MRTSSRHESLPMEGGSLRIWLLKKFSSVSAGGNSAGSSLILFLYTYNFCSGEVDKCGNQGCGMKADSSLLKKNASVE